MFSSLFPLLSQKKSNNSVMARSSAIAGGTVGLRDDSGFVGLGREVVADMGLDFLAGNWLEVAMGVSQLEVVVAGWRKSLSGSLSKWPVEFVGMCLTGG